MIRYLAGFFMLVIAPAVLAADTTTTTVMGNFKTAAININQQLVAPAIATACTALTLQLILSHWKDLFNADLSSTLAKSVGMITWFGATIALITNQGLLTSAFTGYLGLAGSLSNLTGDQFTPGYMIDNAVSTIRAVELAFDKVTGNNFFAITENFFTAFLLVFAELFVFIAFLTIALNLFVAQLEFWLIFSVAPLAFGLIPISAFRDQGFAPIKGVISLGLRIVILGVVVSVANQLSATVVGLLNAQGLPTAKGHTFDPIWYYLAGMAGCAMMALSAGKIASSIASGSASFSGADAVKGGMQMTAMAGAGAAAAVGLGAIAAKTAGGAAAGASSAAPGIGRAFGEMISGKPSLGVSPASSSSSNGGGGLGGSPTEARPSVADSPSASSSDSSASSAPSSAPSPTTSAPGDASTAGIGGVGAPASSQPQRSALSKFSDATKGAADAGAQDTQAVGFQMHIGKE